VTAHHPAVLGARRLVVLVEGPSDREAVQALSERLGLDLARENAEVVEIGGAQAIARALRELPCGATAAGLCDAGEERVFARALTEVGIARAATRSELEVCGFFVCEPDLEGELIRALGATAVESVLAANGHLSSFRTFQKQPQWSGRPPEDQLRRFFGSSAGKVRYARPLVDALDDDRIPRPLGALLAYVDAWVAQRQASGGASSG